MSNYLLDNQVGIRRWERSPWPPVVRTGIRSTRARSSGWAITLRSTVRRVTEPGRHLASLPP